MVRGVRVGNNFFRNVRANVQLMDLSGHLAKMGGQNMIV